MHIQAPSMPLAGAWCKSRQGDALNFDGHALGQLIDGDAAPSGLVGKVTLIHAIHLDKVIHRGEKDVDLDDLCKRRAGGRQHSRQVLDAQLRHLGNGGARRQGQQLAARTAGNLARAINGAARLDGLRLYRSGHPSRLPRAVGWARGGSARTRGRGREISNLCLGRRRKSLEIHT